MKKNIKLLAKPLLFAVLFVLPAIFYYNISNDFVIAASTAWWIIITTVIYGENIVNIVGNITIKVSDKTNFEMERRQISVDFLQNIHEAKLAMKRILRSPTIQDITKSNDWNNFREFQSVFCVDDTCGIEENFKLFNIGGTSIGCIWVEYSQKEEIFQNLENFRSKLEIYFGNTTLLDEFILPFNDWKNELYNKIHNKDLKDSNILNGKSVTVGDETLLSVLDKARINAIKILQSIIDEKN